MLKEKKWFKEFAKILYAMNLCEFEVKAFTAGVRINKEFQTLTPQEAVDEYVFIEEGLFGADKSGG